MKSYAGHIHSEIGNKCSRVLVNNEIVPLERPLKNGDVVEIITEKSRKGPNRDWLAFVKTQAAKDKIRSATSRK